MTEAFDPYRKWLGIPKERRPPTHYDLLGVSIDEEDAEVIRSAAERQRSHVAKFRGGPRHEAAAQILFEIDEAELTLLDPSMRRAYDRQANLFEKRRKSRRTDPYPTAGELRRGGGAAGETLGLTREFLGIMAVVLAGFIIMTVVAFNLPWPKSNEGKEDAGEPVMANQAAVQEVPKANAAPIADDAPAPDPAEAAGGDAPAADAEQANLAPQFVPLFDGESLAGWDQFATTTLPDVRVNGRAAARHRPTDGAWEVRDAQIVCVAGKGNRGFLRTTRPFSDFILRLEARVPPGCNSGVLFRCPDDPQAALSHVAMEVQLLDDFASQWRNLKPRERSGALWNVTGPERTVLRPGGAWNELEIRCEGSRVQVTLNGQVTADVDMATNPALRNRPRQGFIGLSAEGASEEGPAFRNIELLDLSSSAEVTRTGLPAGRA